MAARNTIRSARLIQARRKMFTTRFIIAGVIVLVGLTALVSTAHLDALTIREVRVEASETFPKQEALALVETMLDESYLWLFPKRNALLYPKRLLAKALTEQFPRSASVTLERTGFQALSISLTERKPYVLWCASTYEGGVGLDEKSATATPEAVSKRCYFSDEHGFIFAPAPGFTGSAYLIYYTARDADYVGQSGFNPLGSRILDEATFSSLNALIDAIGKLGLAARAVLIQNDTYEIELRGGARMIIPREKPFSDTLGIIELVVTDPTFSTRGIEGLEYLDLRFGKKVYYKWK